MRVSFAIASAGTTSNWVQIPTDMELVALYVPTMDSTTLKMDVSLDGSTSLGKVSDNAGADVTIGGLAQTWARSVALSDDSKKQACDDVWVRLVTAAQAGGARTVYGHVRRI